MGGYPLASLQARRDLVEIGKLGIKAYGVNASCPVMQFGKEIAEVRQARI
ncbi:hypothetical protein GGI1_23006 [Acidithiobacillus sp. GGI-221]|nr:hypothetical protein GGI1_23006 [Acidithiobacillus sp. GGI-221]